MLVRTVACCTIILPAIKSKEEAAEVYIRLLVGDLQVRRAIGVLDPLDEAELRRRSEQAVRLAKKIFGSPTDRSG